jgi:hypothetical protein
MRMSKNPLKSRKFWYAVGTIVADVVITQVPGLEAMRKELITVVTGLGVALILAVAGEDMAYWHGRK